MSQKTTQDVLTAIASGMDLAQLTLDGVGYARDTLVATLDVLRNNEPIHRAEGNVAQADFELRAQSEVVSALARLDSTAEEPVFTQYRHNARAAIKALMEAGGGVAVAALHHPDVGDIDLRWGDASDKKSNGYGLAKLIKWHPEALRDLQAFVEQMAVERQGPARIWLARGADVAILSKDWRGTSGNWLLTAYTKKKANTAGGTMDAAGFASPDDTATRGGVGDWIIGLEGGEVKPALDDTTTADVAAMMARLKLTAELSRIKKQIDTLGAAPTDLLAKLKLVAQANEVRKQLGAGVPVVGPAPAPSDTPVESPHVGTLRAIVAGKRDGEGLPELFGLIQEAVNALEEGGALAGEVEALANDAITHWAELEERESVGI